MCLKNRFVDNELMPKLFYKYRKTLLWKEDRLHLMERRDSTVPVFSKGNSKLDILE